MICERKVRIILKKTHRFWWQRDHNADNEKTHKCHKMTPKTGRHHSIWNVVHNYSLMQASKQLIDLSTASIFCSITNLIFVYIYIYIYAHTHITSHNYHKHHTNHWKTDGVLSVLRRAWDFLNLSSSDCNCRVAMQHCARMCFELKLGASFSFPPLNVEPPMLPRTCQGCPMRPIILSSYYHWLVKMVSISVYMKTSWKFSATL